MKHLDLFSGIGGFALAARWAGFETIGFCEIDKYCQKVLKKNFPGVPIYEDVTKLNGDQFKDIYLLTGGFPCQDISIAGKGAGLDGERSGLWSELHRIISEVRPKYALIENVPALTFRGGTRVIGDLTEIGYDCEWQIVGADDVGAPHRRKRIWIVAYSNSGFSERENKEICTGGNSPDSSSKDVAHSMCIGREAGISGPEQGKERFPGITDNSCSERRGREGTDLWLPEPSVGRVVNGLPNRVDRLKGLGNSICPQVAFEIMKLLK